MKTFKNIADWLKTNPSEEEQGKVIALINKGAVNQTRRQIYELERYLRKLQAGENIMKKLGLPFTEEGQKRIKEIKAQIAELSKGLPAPIKRAKKIEEVVEN
jgi:NAD(P)H-dependent FMN reductase